MQNLMQLIIQFDAWDKLLNIFEEGVPVEVIYLANLSVLCNEQQLDKIVYKNVNDNWNKVLTS